MSSQSSPAEPVVIDTTGEEIPASVPRRPDYAARPARLRREGVVPFAATLRRLTPDGSLWREV